jgi:hypothetical protein
VTYQVRIERLLEVLGIDKTPDVMDALVVDADEIRKPLEHTLTGSTLRGAGAVETAKHAVAQVLDRLQVASKHSSRTLQETRTWSSAERSWWSSTEVFGSNSTLTRGMSPVTGHRTVVTLESGEASRRDDRGRLSIKR